MDHLGMQAPLVGKTANSPEEKLRKSENSRLRL